MSYISREAAVELLSQPITMSLCLSVDECHHKIAQQRIDRYLIEKIPAADVRSAVPGKWELSDETPYIRKHYHPVACSNCHRAGMKGWNYCPNCGARMEES